MTSSRLAANHLSEQGLFARSQPGFEYRPAQYRMAAIVEELAKGETLRVVEAASGVGKTLAYLVPLLSMSRRVIISTANHFLQEQLLDRDIPLVNRVLGISPSVTVLKGRSNYICPYFTKQRLREAGRIPHAKHHLVEKVLEAFRLSGEGDIKRLPTASLLSNYLTCSSEDCLGSACPDYGQCPLIKARKSAAYSDVLILNHSLLLSGQLNGLRREDERPEVLVIDEAHRLYDFGQPAGLLQLSSRTLAGFFRDSFEAVGEGAAEQAQVLKYLQRSQSVVKDLHQKLPAEPEAAAHRDIVLQFRSGLKDLHNWLVAFDERSAAFSKLALRCEHILESLEHILSGEGLCHIQNRGRGFVIQSVPLSPLSAMQRFIESHADKPLLMTSATLSVGGDASYFLQKLGLDNSCFERIEGGHNYRDFSRLYLPTLGVLPGEMGFDSAFASALAELITITEGRVLVLLSSHRALRETASALSDCSRDLLVQGQGTDAQLIKDFRHNEQAVLLGTGSYWEGLDLSGAPLSVVAIDKLPFASPDQPLVNVRSAYLRRNGVDAFGAYLLPEAAMRLSQGCGRLLRRAGEKGVIMLADSRLRDRDYGEYFLASLPAMPIVSSVQEVRDFLREDLKTTKETTDT